MVDLELELETQLVTVKDPSPTISVLWDQAVQQAVINTTNAPTVASRAYSMLHTAMYDAWSAYDPLAIATTSGDDWQQPTAEITEANKQEAMSYAAYAILTELFPSEVEIFNDLMAQLGYNPDKGEITLSTAEGIGNLSAQSIIQLHEQDGSNQLIIDDNVYYQNNSTYNPLNLSPERMVNIEQWTPEHIPLDDPQAKLQEFLTAHWGNVKTFTPESSLLLPKPPEPFLLVDGLVDLEEQTITLTDGSVVIINPDLIGTIINPEFINQAEQVIDYSANLTDEQKLIAEFWEDAAGTSLPPGTWMTFGQYVSARDNHSLDDDAKLFFMLGNAVCDAGIATWRAKTYYDYARPVRTIRTLGELGLIGEYNPSLGGYAIQAWQPNEGTQTILATDFLTYQTPGGHPSPPFAEYTSGHSAFSAAGAEILQQFTGSDFFGAEVTFDVGSSRFEPGLTPQKTVTLSWETFSEAADEAGISRLYGGIHFQDGDLNGRILGRQVGEAVFEQAQFYINGGLIKNKPILGTSGDDIVEIVDSPGIVFAGDGNDLIDATTSNYPRLSDRLYGGDGSDILIGNQNDRLFGQDGDDWFFTHQGGNTITGGEGADWFWIIANSAVSSVDWITDFDLNQDLLGMSNFRISGISFDDLVLTENERGTTVSVDDVDLVFLEHIASTDLKSSHFWI